jgi:hypothetical protein
MSKDLSRLRLHAIVNYTAVAGDAAAATTIPVQGLTANNLTACQFLYSIVTNNGAAAFTTLALVNGGISLRTGAGTDLSTYQFSIYIAE